MRTAPDGKTIGWLVDYSNTGEPSPEAGTLVIVRSGHVIRRFETNQIFWGWSFYDQGKQVTYHSGPNHGDFAEHSELHDIESGHLVAQWDHDPSGANDTKMPSWAAALDRK